MPRMTSGTQWRSPATDVLGRQIFISALIAGAIAGLIGAVLQLIFVEPLILEGELFEQGVRVHFADGVAESIAAAPALAFDLKRYGLTVAFSLVTWIGFGLVLAAGLGIAERSGSALNARKGATWGLLAFMAVNLAPAAGLPPELPGTAAAVLEDRQIWWAGTIIASLLAIVAFGFTKGGIAAAVGLFLILLPHVLGAPHLDQYHGVAPPELAALFVGRTLAVAALTWAILGALLGLLWSKN